MKGRDERKVSEDYATPVATCKFCNWEMFNECEAIRCEGRRFNPALTLPGRGDPVVLCVDCAVLIARAVVDRAAAADAVANALDEFCDSGRAFYLEMLKRRRKRSESTSKERDE